LPSRHGVVEQVGGVADHGANALGHAEVVGEDLVEADVVVDAEGARDGLLVVGQERVERAEQVGVQQVGHADAAAADLVFVARADAARGGADGDAVHARFAHLLHHAVEGEDDVGAVADGDLAGDVDAGLFEHVEFVEQRLGVHHHAVADHAARVGMKHAAWNQLQDELLRADLDGVARVVAALIAGDDVKFLREQIDDLALAFVAPLGAQHDDVAHDSVPKLFILSHSFAHVTLMIDAVVRRFPDARRERFPGSSQARFDQPPADLSDVRADQGAPAPEQAE
jgi:hypothetical protein